MKNLIFVHLFNDYSGSPAVLKNVIEISSQDENNQLTLFTSNHSGFLDELNCSIVRKSIFYVKSSNKIIQLLFFLIAQIHLFFSVFIFLIKKKRDNNIVFINTLLPFGAALAAKLCSAKIVYYLHEVSISPRPLFDFLRFIMYKTVTEQIFVSSFVKDALCKVNSKYIVIHNSISESLSKESQRVNISQKDKFINKNILFVGSLKKYKGIDVIRTLAEKIPEFNFTVVLNCTKKELCEYLDGKCTISNIQYISRPENISDYYTGAFCVLNLSLPDQCVETFGLTLLEGMAFYTPVLAPPVGGPTEFVTNKCGKLVSSYCINDICMFLNYLASDFHIWKTYSDEAYIQSLNYTYETFQNNILAFNKSLK
ncbi:glycosyltransferase family 4 protein [Aliivibrio fischeri]|uniref:glycosyltransferase family 4 protein n=1 Tax=Aliivibrio fischeri TaxID=668 RepID=UPI0018C84EE1|nr:glycosyltransferase family 4 protein [Aliivibrio fischeri]